MLPKSGGFLEFSAPAFMASFIEKIALLKKGNTLPGLSGRNR
jgi:hypothetical protein